MTSDLGEAKSVDRSNNFCRPAHQLWASEPLSDATQRLSLAQTILLKKRASYIASTYTHGIRPKGPTALATSGCEAIRWYEQRIASVL